MKKVIYLLCAMILSCGINLNATSIPSMATANSSEEVSGWIDLGNVDVYYLGRKWTSVKLYGVSFGNKFLYKVKWGASYYNVTELKGSTGFNASVTLPVATEKRVYSGMNDANGYGIMKTVDTIEERDMFLDVPQW